MSKRLPLALALIVFYSFAPLAVWWIVSFADRLTMSATYDNQVEMIPFMLVGLAGAFVWACVNRVVGDLYKQMKSELARKDEVQS